MTKSEKKAAILIGCVIVFFAVCAVAVCAVWVGFTHVGRASWNLWTGSVQKVDDATNYRTKKNVEDTCRAMVSSYESDKLTYQQYKDSASAEKQSWAEQAKMRENKTAATYNNYILENSFLWSGNVPAEVKSELTYLE